MRRLAFVLAALVLAACRDSTTAPSMPLPALGAYTYASPGVGGTLTLATADSALLTGTWQAITPRGAYPAAFTAARQGEAWVSVEVVNAAPPLAPWITVHRWTVVRGALACTANGGVCTVTRVP